MINDNLEIFRKITGKINELFLRWWKSASSLIIFALKILSNPEKKNQLLIIE